MNLQAEIQTVILNERSEKLTGLHALRGGDTHNVYVLQTDQSDYCIKINHHHTFPDMFEAEAQGLRLLQQKSHFSIPEVLSVGTLASNGFLLLEFLPFTPQKATFSKQFGRNLAEMHRVSNAYFGLDHDNYMGSLPQHNPPHSSFETFFYEARIEPQLRLAIDSGKIPTSAVPNFERFGNRLGSIVPNEAPALVHGDLWQGNFMTDKNGQATLIDPAVSYSHRETDIAMSALFGGFSPDFYAAYHAHYPLAGGWKKRLPYFQLYPLLIHVNLFGGGYSNQVLRIIQEF